jgi:hypothetical protein
MTPKLRVKRALPRYYSMRKLTHQSSVVICQRWLGLFALTAMLSHQDRWMYHCLVARVMTVAANVCLSQGVAVNDPKDIRACNFGGKFFSRNVFS